MRSREDLLAMIEQGRRVCERRTAERDEALSELARVRAERDAYRSRCQMSDDINRLHEQRAALVMLGQRNAAQQSELDQIDAKLDGLPTGGTPQQRRAWDVLQRVAARTDLAADIDSTEVSGLRERDDD